MKVGVIGAGAWGSALAILCKKAGNFTILWSFDGVANLPFDGEITKNLQDLADMDAWLIATPGAFFRETIRKCRPFWQKQPIIICTKGMENGQSNKFMSEILAEELPGVDMGILSGPQFATEAAKGVPTGSTIAGNKIAIKTAFAVLSSLYLEETDDIIGVEVCGVGKNAAAIAAGYYSARVAGENEFAMNLGRIWREITQIGRAIGAKPETFDMLCGVGDLLLSATSKSSRNFSAGLALGEGRPLDPNATIEGISAIKGLMALAKKHGISIPILSEIHSKI
jgi:glycerol-3-phosphate dehydrogenase (NAD(P)+)